MSEERLQSEVVKYIQLQYPKAKYCASLGGIRTSFKQAVKAKRTGYVKGFPDLFIYEARNGYHGLALEIKTHKGRATEVQKQWIQDLQDRGYKATIGKGLPECLQIIDDYMNQPNTTTCKCQTK